MSDRGDTAEEEREATVEGDAEDDDVVLDVSAAEERERQFEELRETVADQQERIEELEDLMLDLSVRAADDRGMGVCPECHGPVMKVSRWLRSNTIECRRCGEVYHTY